MERFQYFYIMDDGSNCACLECKDGKIEVQTHLGTKLLYYDKWFYSKKLKDLIERLDVNHLIKFRQLEFFDPKYKEEEYYVLEQLPIINCYDLEKCGGIYGGYEYPLKKISREKAIKKLNVLPQLSYARLGENLKLVDERDFRTSIHRAFLSSELLEQYTPPPIFYVTSGSFLHCNSAFVKACRKQGISGMWWKGIPCDLLGGEPDGFLGGQSSYD